MISLGTILAITCALASALAQQYLQEYKHSLANSSSVDRRVLQRLASLLEQNRTININDVDKRLVNKLRSLVNETVEAEVLARLSGDGSYNSYEAANQDRSHAKISTVEESPAYGSSVVLASDLLSLTSAVANVQEKGCREQGYRFLDGLLMNKRWALRSKFPKVQNEKCFISSNLISS